MGEVAEGVCLAGDVGFIDSGHADSYMVFDHGHFVAGDEIAVGFNLNVIAEAAIQHHHGATQSGYGGGFRRNDAAPGGAGGQWFAPFSGGVAPWPRFRLGKVRFWL